MPRTDCGIELWKSCRSLLSSGDGVASLSIHVDEALYCRAVGRWWCLDWCSAANGNGDIEFDEFHRGWGFINALEIRNHKRVTTLESHSLVDSTQAL